MWNICTRTITREWNIETFLTIMKHRNLLHVLNRFRNENFRLLKLYLKLSLHKTDIHIYTYIKLWHSMAFVMVLWSENMKCAQIHGKEKKYVFLFNCIYLLIFQISFFVLEKTHEFRHKIRHEFLFPIN